MHERPAPAKPFAAQGPHLQTAVDQLLVANPRRQDSDGHATSNQFLNGPEIPHLHDDGWLNVLVVKETGKLLRRPTRPAVEDQGLAANFLGRERATVRPRMFSRVGKKKLIFE